MQQKKTTSSIIKPLVSTLKRFHLTIFFVLVASLLTYGVLMINQMLIDGESDGAKYTSSIDAGSIDQSTLQRIQALHTSEDAPNSVALPQGRVNPFGE